MCQRQEREGDPGTFTTPVGIAAERSSEALRRCWVESSSVT